MRTLIQFRLACAKVMGIVGKAPAVATNRASVSRRGAPNSATSSSPGLATRPSSAVVLGLVPGARSGELVRVSSSSDDDERLPAASPAASLAAVRVGWMSLLDDMAGALLVEEGAGWRRKEDGWGGGGAQHRQPDDRN